MLDDWVSRMADELIAASAETGTPPVCASGISPSGPIHLGNLREVLTPHLVADEVRRRGVPCEHLISWDDYDRFRKVPEGIDGVDEGWREHIGRPLTAVPAPRGSAHESWAAHFRAPFEASLQRLGVDYRSISQTEQYRSGRYRDQVVFAMRHRREIDAVLDRFRTLERTAEAAEDGASDSGYSPYKPYCAVCGRDTTTVTEFDDVSTELAYTCRCGHAETVRLDAFDHGKLVWKVDWPMRWACERVLFEPSGVDHQSPGSSFSVGLDLAPLFGWRRPIGPMYAFVGIKGMAKMSSSRGGVPTPADALRYLEPPVLRWMYARRKPNQSFEVAFDADLLRLYDEWDALRRKVSDQTAGDAEVAAHARASSTSAGPLATAAIPVAYRTLASIVDVSAGDEEQLLRIVDAMAPEPVAGLDALQPRLGCVQRWVDEQFPAAERTTVRAEPALDLLAALDAEERADLALLLDGNQVDLPAIERAWTVEGLTVQVFGVPKVRLGIPTDQLTKGDKQVAAVQRAFFRLLYRLLVDAETGPRLPTLLLAIGQERLRALLTVPPDR